MTEASFIPATGPAAAAAADTTPIANDPFYPDLAPAAFRAETGLGEIFDAARVAATLKAAIAETNATLAPWRARLPGAPARLAELPAPRIGGESVKLLHYRAAVFARARARGGCAGGNPVSAGAQGHGIEGHGIETRGGAAIESWLAAMLEALGPDRRAALFRDLARDPRRRASARLGRQRERAPGPATRPRGPALAPARTSPRRRGPSARDGQDVPGPAPGPPAEG